MDGTRLPFAESGREVDPRDFLPSSRTLNEKEVLLVLEPKLGIILDFPEDFVDRSVQGGKRCNNGGKEYINNIPRIDGIVVL